ncbi:MAG: hypothetical protein H6Q90_7275 [Deltaproteobacteria bacterium]|nr:hypothetical protein [Deltaproteobacteria bacterium]
MRSTDGLPWTRTPRQIKAITASITAAPTNTTEAFGIVIRSSRYAPPRNAISTTKLQNSSFEYRFRRAWR